MNPELLKLFSADSYGERSLGELNAISNGLDLANKPSLPLKKYDFAESISRLPIMVASDRSQFSVYPPIYEEQSVDNESVTLRGSDAEQPNFKDKSHLLANVGKKISEKMSTVIEKIRPNLREVSALGMVALLAVGCASASKHSARKSSSVTANSTAIPKDFNHISLTDTVPATWTDGAFFPQDNTVNNYTTAASRVQSWFKDGPLYGSNKTKTVAESLAFAETITEQVLNKSGLINDSFNYQTAYQQNYQRLNAPNGIIKAKQYLENTSVALGATETYAKNLSGTTFTEMSANANGTLQINHVSRATLVNQLNSNTISGLEFSLPKIEEVKLLGQQVSLESIAPVLITPDGKAIIEGYLPNSGNSTNINKQGGKKPLTKTPSGVQTGPVHIASSGTSQNNQVNQAFSGGVTTANTSPEQNQGNASSGSSNANSIGSLPQSTQGNLPTPSGGVTTGNTSPEKKPGNGTGVSTTGTTPAPTPTTTPTPPEQQTPPPEQQTPPVLKPAEPITITVNSSGNGTSNPFQVTTTANGLTSNMGSTSSNSSGLAQ